MNTNVIGKRNTFTIPDDDLQAVQAAVQILQAKPAFVDIDNFSHDVTAFGVLRSLQQPVSQIADMLDDSQAVTGSDAMNAALAYFQSVKMANKLNVPGAGTITDDLSTRFAGQGLRGPVKVPTAA